MTEKGGRSASSAPATRLQAPGRGHQPTLKPTVAGDRLWPRAADRTSMRPAGCSIDCPRAARIAVRNLPLIERASMFCNKPGSPCKSAKSLRALTALVCVLVGGCSRYTEEPNVLDPAYQDRRVVVYQICAAAAPMGIVNVETASVRPPKFGGSSLGGGAYEMTGRTTSGQPVFEVGGDRRQVDLTAIVVYAHDLKRSQFLFFWNHAPLEDGWTPWEDAESENPISEDIAGRIIGADAGLRPVFRVPVNHDFKLRFRATRFRDYRAPSQRREDRSVEEIISPC